MNNIKKLTEFKTKPFVYYSISCCDLHNHAYIQDEDRLDNKVFVSKKAAIEYIKWWTDAYKSKLISSITGEAFNALQFKNRFEYLGFYKGLTIDCDYDEIKVIYSIKERKKEEVIHEINVDGKTYSRTETVYSEWVPTSGNVKEFHRYIGITKEELKLIHE